MIITGLCHKYLTNMQISIEITLYNDNQTSAHSVKVLLFIHYYLTLKLHDVIYYVQ